MIRAAILYAVLCLAGFGSASVEQAATVDSVIQTLPGNDSVLHSVRAALRLRGVDVASESCVRVEGAAVKQIEQMRERIAKTLRGDSAVLRALDGATGEDDSPAARASRAQARADLFRRVMPLLVRTLAEASAQLEIELRAQFTQAITVESLVSGVRAAFARSVWIAMIKAADPAMLGVGDCTLALANFEDAFPAAPTVAKLCGDDRLLAILDSYDRDFHGRASAYHHESLRLVGLLAESITAQDHARFRQDLQAIRRKWIEVDRASAATASAIQLLIGTMSGNERALEWAHWWRTQQYPIVFAESHSHRMLAARVASCADSTIDAGELRTILDAYRRERDATEAVIDSLIRADGDTLQSIPPSMDSGEAKVNQWNRLIRSRDKVAEDALAAIDSRLRLSASADLQK